MPKAKHFCYDVSLVTKFDSKEFLIIDNQDICHISNKTVMSCIMVIGKIGPPNLFDFVSNPKYTQLYISMCVIKRQKKMTCTDGFINDTPSDQAYKA